jgi:uracil-DNA glycosylase family 4
MMDSRRLAYLRALDIDVWQRRDLAPVPAPQPAAVPDRAPEAAPASEIAPAITPAVEAQPRVAADSDVSALGWTELQERVSACTLCSLHATRTRPVFGVGNRNASWMVIGEAPGADEDRQGEPFVGRAGQLLNSMLKAMGLAREEVYIANILKSRPPNNRDPRPEEVRACIPYLYRQIELVNPVIILCVGRIAAQTLLDTDATIGKLRGKVYQLPNGRPMVVTYHPAYLLRSPVEKRKAWADLVMAMKTYERLAAQEARA